MSNKKLSKKDIIEKEKKEVEKIKKKKGLEDVSTYINNKYNVYISPNYIKYLLKKPRSSLIFSESELKAIEALKQEGDAPSNILLYRVKPKVKELLNYWFPRKHELENILEATRRDTENSSPEEKNS